ncbi:unnamed protein product [Phytomonas sp. Hart1]|nr:unnamed protein product [Phytomonas sp. Hart1]|eukprot:CCW66213.1 unnamed protein product [Phytomonas sp. isolate Hart1]
MSNVDVTDGFGVLSPLLKYDPPITVATPSHSSFPKPDLEALLRGIRERGHPLAEKGDPLSIPASRLATAQHIAREYSLASETTSAAVEEESLAIAGRHCGGSTLSRKRPHDTRRGKFTNRGPSTNPFSFAYARHKGAPADGSARGPSNATAMPMDVDTTSLNEVLPYLMRNDIRDGVSILRVIFPPQVETPTFLTENTPSTKDPSEDQTTDKPGPFPASEVMLRYVSTTPASRGEITKLHEALCDRLQQRQASPVGICPIRRDIYDDAFCELIRQVMLEDAARGVLLKRLKDESDHTIEVHKSLVERAHSFSTRKEIESRQATIQPMLDRVESLKMEIRELEVKKHDRLMMYDKVGGKIDEARTTLEKTQKQELTYWRKVNQQLSAKLKNETERISNGAPTNVNTVSSVDKRHN